MGTLGRVAAYFGTVESQGRGTLHLHLLIWLEHTPSPDEMAVLLQSPDFRDRVRSYIQANLRAYVCGLESADSVKSVPRETEIAYSRPINPASPNYHEELRAFELRLARAEQIHTCRLRQCLTVQKNGAYACKRRAPFPCSESDVVLENGHWCQKRLYGFVNGWVPAVLLNARCNNDGKFLSNGRDTKDITFYVTSYAAKKQGKSHNLSAIMANAYAYHVNHPNPKYVNTLQKQQEHLLSRLVNAVNREQEIAAPMIISYLMDWDDTFCSHYYSPVYWSSFVASLRSTHPDWASVGFNSER